MKSKRLLQIFVMLALVFGSFGNSQHVSAGSTSVSLLDDAMISMKPAILCIILCYNGVQDTLACLESLRHVTYPNLDLLVVDNASSDTTVIDVRQQFPEVRLIETGANLGFAAGNNVGLRYALEQGYEYALLLNNDTEVALDFLDQLIAIAEQDATIGVLGPTIYYHEQPDLIWSAGGMVNWQRGSVAIFSRHCYSPHDFNRYTNG